MDGPHLALLFSRAATLRESRSGYPDAPQVEPAPTVRERLRARSAARSAARTARAGRRAVRSAERVVRAALPAARSESPTPASPEPAGTWPTDPTGCGGERRGRSGGPAGLHAADLAQQLPGLVRLLGAAQHRVGRRDDLAGRREVPLAARRTSR